MQHFLANLKELKLDLEKLSEPPEKNEMRDIFSRFAIITHTINSEQELWKIDLWKQVESLDEVKQDIEQSRLEEAKRKIEKDIGNLIKVMEEKGIVT
jgi:hypothetical protein